jgi:diadenosine tetraphosphate (Ap4A) HIT family hydrolase
MVAQLHIHHIVRYQTDSAWPAPVWGKFTAAPYTNTQMTERVRQVTAQLSEKLQLIA